MPIILSFVPSILGWLFKAGASAFLAPVLAVLKWALDVLVDLSGSPQGRVVLYIAVGALSVLFLRFHWLEQGRAEAAPRHVSAIVQQCKPAAPLDPFSAILSMF